MPPVTCGLGQPTCHVRESSLGRYECQLSRRRAFGYTPCRCVWNITLAVVQAGTSMMGSVLANAEILLQIH